MTLLLEWQKTHPTTRAPCLTNVNGQVQIVNIKTHGRNVSADQN